MWSSGCRLERRVYWKLSCTTARALCWEWLSLTQTDPQKTLSYFLWNFWRTSLGKIGGRKTPLKWHTYFTSFTSSSLTVYPLFYQECPVEIHYLFFQGVLAKVTAKKCHSNQSSGNLSPMSYLAVGPAPSKTILKLARVISVWQFRAQGEDTVI